MITEELKPPFIPGVSKVDLSSIEKTFREKRVVSRDIKKGRSCKVENMRLVLKHWNTPQEISDKQIKKKNLSRYRSLVYAYLKDENTNKVPQGYKPIIEEYKNFITNSENMNEKTHINKVDKSINKSKTSIKRDASYEKPEYFIKMLSQLKSLGVKEFNIKF